MSYFIDLRLNASNDPVTAGLEINALTAAEPVLILQTLDDDPTNPILEIQDSGGVMLSEIDALGNLNFATATAANPGMIEINDVRFLHNYGTGNILIGSGAGNFTLTGSNNIGIGPGVLALLTTGLSNICLGLNSGIAITTGQSNVCVGVSAGRALTTGIGNFALGTSALRTATTPSGNVAVGVEALRLLTTGQFNIGIGNKALRGILTGTRSIGIGASAGLVSTGSENIFIGGLCGSTHLGGDFNTFVGGWAGRGVGNHTAAENTVIGYEAGRNFDTADNNVLIGYRAGDVITTGDGNIIIGHDIDPSAAGASDELNIGGIIFGDLSVPDVRLGDRAANHVRVDNDGEMSFEGTATVWNDIFFPMSSGRIGGANQPSWAAFQGNTFEYTFAINDYIHLPSGEILHSYKEGSDIELHAHIVLDGSDVGDTDVNYEIEYTIGDVNEVMSAAAIVTSGDYTIAGGTADRMHIRINIGTITGTNLLSMSALKMRFRRIALVGGGNAPSNDPFVLMVGVHIEEDTVGSRTEDAK